MIRYGSLEPAEPDCLLLTCTRMWTHSNMKMPRGRGSMPYKMFPTRFRCPKASSSPSNLQHCRWFVPLEEIEFMSHVESNWQYVGYATAAGLDKSRICSRQSQLNDSRWYRDTAHQYMKDGFPMKSTSEKQNFTISSTRCWINWLIILSEFSLDCFPNPIQESLNFQPGALHMGILSWLATYFEVDQIIASTSY